ncbi:MAG: phosphoribosylanthranilate isomerase [Geminicoccaceae bacterium]
MAVDVKICGLKDRETVAAAVEGGARYLGFNFYPPSPRAVTPEEALALGEAVGVERVGVMVDPDDRLIEDALHALDAFQLHGKETPERVRQVKEKTGKTVIKALRIAEAGDLAPLEAYAEAADIILFDAKPPTTPGSLPGGNGLSFDWRLLDGLTLDVPWILSGGLDVGNLGDAVDLCRASAVDVASGVESAPGVKDAAKIRAFLALAATLPAPAGPEITAR